MVGIPGRSKGCHTCRRRRIRCDLAKPQCKNCTDNNRICEGYARVAVFLNRTLDGLMKRKPLEEAISDTGDPHHVLPTSTRQRISIVRNFFGLHHSTTTNQRTIEKQFLNLYLARENTTAWPSPGIYVLEVFTMERNDLLDFAVKAVSFCRVGRVIGDNKLVEQGAESYILALGQLRTALSSPNMIQSDCTLAATKILNLHEMYEPTASRKNGVVGHGHALAALANTRILSRNDPKVVKLLLEGSRYNNMISSLQKWKDPIFARAEWRTTSLTSITDFEQRLYDFGFDLGKLREDLREALGNSQSRSFIEIEKVSQLVQDSLAIYDGVSEWYARLQAWVSMPIYWTVTDGSNQLESNAHLTFSHLVLAHLLLDYWSITILLNLVMETLSDVLLQHSGTSLLARSDLFEISASRLRTINHGRAAQIQLANKIECTMSYCCRPEMGMIGPQRTMLALRVCLALFRQLEGEDARAGAERFSALLKNLGTEYGIRYAIQLAENPFPTTIRGKI